MKLCKVHTKGIGQGEMSRSMEHWQQLSCKMLLHSKQNSTGSVQSGETLIHKQNLSTPLRVPCARQLPVVSALGPTAPLCHIGAAQ